MDTITHSCNDSILMVVLSDILLLGIVHQFSPMVLRILSCND